MLDNNDVLNEYFSCLYNLQNNNGEPMKRFRLEHPKEYDVINGAYHKRVKLMKIIDFMKTVGAVYFGSLTFNDKEDAKSIPTKRKQAWRHLNAIFSVVAMVEELGFENGRYHIHFVGVFRDGKTFDDFFKWHSREDIQKVVSKQKTCRYLCDYISKEVPRIRQNGALIAGMKHYNKGKGWKENGFSSFAAEEFRVSREVVDFINELD